MNEFLDKKIYRVVENLQKAVEKKLFAIDEMKICESAYKKIGEKPAESDFDKVFKYGERLSGRDKHFWMSFKLKTPSVEKDKELRLKFTTGYEGEWDALNPQGLLYLDGITTCGLDVNHREVWLEPNREYDVLIYFYVGMIETETKFLAELYEVDLPTESLMYDIEVPYKAALCLDDNDYNKVLTYKYLEQAANILDFRYPGSDMYKESVKKTADFLKKEYYEGVCGKTELTTSYVGHTHIDVAWQWTVAQTREKTQRSFSTVLRLMERYPEYIFMSSQPQLYQYVKEEEPELYEKIKERIKEGRWEADGAMWLEADCNLSSGESLVRQIIHGKKFMKEEFGVDNRTLWLPDVFGYSAALPQILKKSGVDKFVTSKISWSETNKMPYDIFMWQGIDGTEIFTYFLSAQNVEAVREGFKQTTYVGDVTPSMNLGTWERFQQKEYVNDTIVTFGYGDGGGGPTAKMLENERRLEYGIPGMPKARMTTAADFLNKAEESFKENCEKLRYTPKWVGELYLELHRGTYTSMAKNKKKNRECEFLCQQTEALAVFNNVLFGTAYPAEMFDRNWKILLLNQFHDIIPGSSIKEVYDDSDKDYAKVYDEVGTNQNNYIKAIADKVSDRGVFVYNPNSYKVSAYAEYNGDLIYVEDIPAFGWKVVQPKAEQNNIVLGDKSVETPVYSVKFDDDMNIVSLFDKENNREVAAKGKKLNQLKIYEDIPKEWDNWEISSYYKSKMWELNRVEKVEKVVKNGAGGFKITRRYMSSTVTQTIMFYEKSRRIDFITEADWHEKHVLLKAAFPVSVLTNKASYDIQFGNVERTNNENTSWDKARFEVCAHKWGDLSEENYGVSILNNCKYGYSAVENEMELTLIKCGTFPNTEADQGEHTFTYSVYPHKDGFKRGGTIKESYLLNCPLITADAAGGGILPSEYGMISCDAENIIIETVKQSEDGKGIIVRLFDTWNMKSRVKVNFGFEAKSIKLCDFTENIISDLGSGSQAEIDMSNFEITTLYLEI